MERSLQQTRPDKKLDLICFGNPTVDTIIAGNQRRVCPGGSAMNTAAAFAGLGGTAGLMGRIGTDDNGRFILEKIKEKSIDFRRLHVDEEPTFTNDIVVTPETRNMVHTSAYHGIKKLDNKDREYVLQSRAVLVGLRNELFTECAELTTKERILLYVSAHRYTEEKAKLHKLCLNKYRIEAVIGDESEIEVVKRHSRLDQSISFVITRGAKGSMFSGLGIVVSTEPYIVKSVDPTGAGDGFAAGYIFTDLNGVGPAECLSMANACGALIVQGYGAQQPITLEEVRKMIEKRTKE